MIEKEIIQNALPDNIWQVIVILAGPGILGLIVRQWFKKPITKAQADRQKNDAAMVLIDGFERSNKAVFEQLERDRKYYTERILALETKIEEREKKYQEELLKKDQQIEGLRSQIATLTGRLAQYEGMRSRIVDAEAEIKHTTEESLGKAVAPQPPKVPKKPNGG